ARCGPDASVAALVLGEFVAGGEPLVGDHRRGGGDAVLARGAQGDGDAAVPGEFPVVPDGAVPDLQDGAVPAALPPPGVRLVQRGLAGQALQRDECVVPGFGVDGVVDGAVGGGPGLQ